MPLPRVLADTQLPQLMAFSSFTKFPHGMRCFPLLPDVHTVYIMEYAIVEIVEQYTGMQNQLFFR